MKKIVFILFLNLNFVVSQEKSKVISGTVTDGRAPLENVKISIKGNSTSRIFTDVQGRYQIAVTVGGIISYSYTGMKPI